MRSTASVLALTFATAFLLATLGRGREDDAPPPVAVPVAVLPGVTADGFVQLPNQWRLRPAGVQIELGDFPVNSALHPSGEYLAVLHCGYGPHEIAIVHLQNTKRRILSRVVVDQAFLGLCFAPDGKTVFVSGGEFEVVHAFDFADGYLSNRRAIRMADVKSRFVPGGLAVSPDGATLAVAAVLGNAVGLVSLADPTKVVAISLGPTGKAIPGDRTGPSFRDNEGGIASKTDTTDECFPYGVLFDPTGKRLYVSLWNKAAVAVIDVAERKIVATLPTERHPTEMVQRADGKALYVACSNSTKVSVLDPGAGKPLQTLNCSLYPAAPSGNTPNSLCLTPDGDILFVANADANNVAAFNVSDRDDAKPLGFIPVGWYPTSVRFNAKDKHIYVTNGKGASSRTNRYGPNPLARRPGGMEEYIGGLMRGTLSAIPMPKPDEMARHSRVAYQCSPLRSDTLPVGVVPPNSPIPSKVGDASPIKHVIYIVKENRTYDQVFGDMKQGNGEPALCLFPEEVTPNHHALAREFVLLDNTYVDGEVSADGHEWSMGAYATDFVEKVWPLSYRSPSLKKLGYPAEGAYDSVARPAGGYLWDRAAEAGVTYRSYGEWIENPKEAGGKGKASVKALEGHFDPEFHSYDLDYPDAKRADRFIAELQRFERDGGMPQLSIVRLPNDHTSGTRAGKPTPTAMVAENDLALGRLVEAVSKSKFWKETAIFVIEDDAQNGPDHVDAHRVVALVVSPYTKRNYVDSSMYSTSSMLRTMELILGLKPMSQFDAAARPMYNAFQPVPDARVYAHRPARVDVNAKNTALAWGADLSEKFDLTKEDQADDLLFNEVIWRSVKGATSAMPAPVRAAFVFPHETDGD